MTRDELALETMKAMLSGSHALSDVSVENYEVVAHNIAGFSYQIADAMLEQAEGKKGSIIGIRVRFKRDLETMGTRLIRSGTFAVISSEIFPDSNKFLVHVAEGIEEFKVYVDWSYVEMVK